MAYFLTVWILVHSEGHQMFPIGGEYESQHLCEHALEDIKVQIPPRMGWNLELIIEECDEIY